MAEATFAKGLEGIVAAESDICRIDGDTGQLYYMGYSITDLVDKCTFEEVAYLLLYGELPTKDQLQVFGYVYALIRERHHRNAQRSLVTYLQPQRDEVSWNLLEKD